MKKRNPHRRRKSGERKAEDFEPRRYTREDESFARRLNDAFRFKKGLL